MTAQPYNRFVIVSWSWHLLCNETRLKYRAIQVIQKRLQAVVISHYHICVPGRHSLLLGTRECAIQHAPVYRVRTRELGILFYLGPQDWARFFLRSSKYES